MDATAMISQDDEEDESFEKFVKKVLNKAATKIREELKPDGILDIFQERKVLSEPTFNKIRDIREEKSTSDKNRYITEICYKHPNIYITFKEGLATTGQHGLLADLAAFESEEHDSLQEPHHCDSTEFCILLQKLKYQQLEVSTQTSKIIQELQHHLLSKYGEKHLYWENPVTSEEARLSEMYVQPSVKRIMEINEHGEMEDVKEPCSQTSKLNLKDIFKSKTGGLCKNVYVTGEAGVGKSTFCSQLVLNWCSSLQNKQANKLSFEDQKLLSSFSFLFHINLRETETTYHVEDMIQEQLLSLSNVPGDLNISDILNSERCLIVLDGLDEWSCPDNTKKCPNLNKHVPGRNTTNKNCVFITTTRKWKYDVIALKNQDIDKHLEFSGIDGDEPKKLAQNVLDHLDIDLESNKKVYDFLADVQKKKLNEFLSLPVLLIQLITLWVFGKDFGNSQLQLSCSMLELMFERSEKSIPDEISKCSSTTAATPKKLPECFSTKDNCQKYAELLNCLARLAYKALFNKQREEALVFKSSKLESFGISPSDIKLCLKCGILSQCKDYGNKTGTLKKFSFLHKKVQECLAALFIVTNDNAEYIFKEVKQFCSSVDTILEMKQVWLFVSGIDPDMTRRLFEHLGDVVSSDERVKAYRQTLDCEYDSLIDDIQNCASDCLSEGINNGHHFKNLCLEDFRVDEDKVNHKRLFFCSDMSKVKSVYIDTYNIGIDAAKLAAVTGQFQQCRSLQKLRLDDSWTSLIPESTVEALVMNNCDSLTSLYLWTKIKATYKLVTGICCSISMSLMALGLSWVQLTHENRQQIVHSLSQSPVIRQLKLSELNYRDNGCSCKVTIDLYAMTRLQELTLWYLNVDNMQSLSHCVDKVVLWEVQLQDTSLRDFARGLSKTGRKVTVDLYWVTLTRTSDELEYLTDFLQSCPGLKLTECEHKKGITWRIIKFHTISQ